MEENLFEMNGSEADKALKRARGQTRQILAISITQKNSRELVKIKVSLKVRKH